MSKFERHGPCDECGSSDAMSWFSDGHGFCFVCNKPTFPDNNNRKEAVDKASTPYTPLTNVFRAIPRRGLTEDAIRKFMIDVNMDKTKDVAHRYPYFKNGRHVGNKVRRREKSFYWEGDPSDPELFGQHVFPPGGRAITVVEGELDAASTWILLGSRYPVVSVGNAATAVEDCRRAFEYLNSFEDIVLVFDKDEPKTRPDGSVFYPGQEAAKKVADLPFPPGKVRILTLEHGKDPNEYLQRGIHHDVFIKEWWRAPKQMPDGLVFGHELWDAIINAPQPFCVETPFEGLNRLIYGLRLGEMVTFTADPKVGKTTVLKTIEYCLLQNEVLKEKRYGIGFMHLEEPKKDLAVGIMGLHVGKRLNLPDTPVSEDELRKAYDEVINTDRVVIWDHFGSNSVDAVVNKIRHMHALGCKYIVLDHFSMLASDMNNPDERKVLDEIATRLKTLTVELDICLIGVIHQNRQGQIRGTAAFEQLSNIVIRLDRDKLDKDEWRRNVMVVTVTENRFSGRTGPASHLFYDDTTGVFVELDEEASQKFEEGLSINDADIPFAQ
jgi:twinkle protein